MKATLNMVRGLVVAFSLGLSATVFAASQDPYKLPEPYATWENAYIKEFPVTQKVLDAMIANSQETLPKPDQDILHNRACAAIAYKMATDQKGSAELRKLSAVTDILHNITKNRDALSDPNVFKRVSRLITTLKQHHKFTASPEFFSDPEILKLKPIAENFSLVHHLTGAVVAGDILTKIGRFSDGEIRTVQATIVAHSTGYWYFRDSIDQFASWDGAWKTVYPQPESELDKFVFDADLISQFVPESVVPDGSKWRTLAAKRWGATNAKEEAHVVYYVFSRLLDETETHVGRAMALEKWSIMKPRLVELMGLEEGQDPIKVLGVPSFWVKK